MSTITTFSVRCNHPGCWAICATNAPTTSEARTIAARHGWSSAGDSDYCPPHVIKPLTQRGRTPT